MNLIKCENEHYYDADKFDTCPHCANLLAEVKVSDILGTNQNKVDTLIPEKSALQNYQKAGHRKVTGWLVCTEGEMQGDSFCLYAGTNHIGRAANMDVALFKEPTVSRENHAQITYDNTENSFSLSTNPDCAVPVFLNETLITKEQMIELHIHDKITLGECQLSFIPFCDQHFKWNEEK